MPIEIRELVIRATVADAAGQDKRLEAALARLRQEILQQCLEKLQAHIERSTER